LQPLNLKLKLFDAFFVAHAGHAIQYHAHGNLTSSLA
jgi:hypothetical protein